jgi:hypothetical protein
MLRIAIAIILVMHGLGHAMGLLAAWTAVPSGLSGGPWLLSNEVTMTSPVGRLWSLVWLTALVATAASGVGLLLNQDWWQPLAVVSAIVSLVAVVPWLNVMPAGSAFGAVLVDLLLLAVLLLPWREQLVARLR